MSAIPLRRDIHYPESDGKPMGETEIHIREIIYLFEALNEHLRGVPDVYVGADMLLYYVEGNPRTFVVPDVFVTRGVPRGERRTYKLWEEGRSPSLIIEVTSDSTRNEDISRKKALYEQLGVEEYILYDPLQDYLRPPLQGFRLADGRYQSIPTGPDGAVLSQTTGVTLRIEERGIRAVNTVTGEPILSNEEVRAAHQAAKERARVAEDELARLRAELDRLRGEH
ncbi:MAG TPA: Uma2 family endonuclease [Thermoanaerobaculia bacterium]|nr:Uma2 family endonuclease [Thermoanaerobaculia bacterium]